MDALASQALESEHSNLPHPIFSCSPVHHSTLVFPTYFSSV